MPAKGAPRRSTPGTLNHLFFEVLEKHARPDAYQVRVNGKYEPISHATVRDRVRRIALGLTSIGAVRGDRIAIFSENRPEWAFADWACLTIGLTDVTVYPTLPPDQIAHILKDSGSSAIFVASEKQAEKIETIRGELPALKHVISFGSEKTHGIDLTLAEVEAKGTAADSADAAARWQKEALAVGPDDLATLIYTSGTTGLPKGVMLTHDNIYSNVMACRDVIPFSGKDVALSFLPLCHIFERMGDYLYWATGTSIAYAESIDTVPANLMEVKPTFCMSVPRLYEKMYARVLEGALSGGFVKKQIFFWARRVAEQWADEKLAGRTPAGLLAWKYGIATKLVFSKLQERTGGRLRYFVSGGGPLAPEINKFFYAAGLEILEGYGLTETSPVIAVNTPKQFRIGTVGPLIEGVEVEIAADGEILARGPQIMKGYYNHPDATKEAIDADGWFHTGDIGVLADGYLAITDRKKDIIVTAGGKNVAPQPIENKVKNNKYVSQAVMLGDKRKFVLLLVVPEWDQLKKWAAIKKLTWTDAKQMLALPIVIAKMEKEVGKEIAGLASFEMPKKIALLEHDFSVERGELTPTLKVKRRVIEKDYKEMIDALYAEAATTAPPAAEH
jgi:long-chain acyl-CoA synthetase